MQTKHWLFGRAVFEPCLDVSQDDNVIFYCPPHRPRRVAVDNGIDGEHSPVGQATHDVSNDSCWNSLQESFSS